jgi:uncharacterized protein (DUF1330 family)
MMSRKANVVFYLTSILATAAVTAMVMFQVNSHSVSERSVYLIGAVTITDPDGIGEYQAIAGPLAGEAGGYIPLAYATPNMIEGVTPAPGMFFIERYDSLEGLQAFIESEGFKDAKKLRDQVADVHFMMWVPALEPGSLPH